MQHVIWYNTDKLLNEALQDENGLFPHLRPHESCFVSIYFMYINPGVHECLLVPYRCP